VVLVFDSYIESFSFVGEYDRREDITEPANRLKDEFKGKLLNVDVSSNIGTVRPLASF
jgi:hypothetical protein